MSPLIEPEVLATLLHDSRVIIIDCRFTLGQADADLGYQYYLQGHIPEARYLDLEKDLSAPVILGKTSRHPLPKPDDFARLLCKFGVRSDSHVVVYDDGGHAMAARAWWQLRWVGVEKVQVLHGGIKSWQGDRYPLTTEKPEIEPSEFSANPQSHILLSAEEVAAQLQEPVFQLVDARAHERFAGKVEPLDGKAGHIPGAVCRPFLENMDENGSFLPPEQLRDRFSDLLNNDLEVVHYCGSGVTACHNILAMEHAGMANTKLYPGSWSEWITDESRPIATGD
ncbi:sulfurtransferase [Endozoicomonas sp. OPT23]|uniref:sulfurtransferase n=1 Tax=Endozoicomonas sp. OPT23 TaxID=2072845 RepID=UPI00129AE819|nr:sulfurtransferase [Endozoicomonas sp. OPT23]MRI33769.1 sulfurtransferase [Endozoicomonas sp. OPT23]